MDITAYMTRGGGHKHAGVHKNMYLDRERKILPAFIRCQGILVNNPLPVLWHTHSEALRTPG
jgi:hypothetical protein